MNNKMKKNKRLSTWRKKFMNNKRGDLVNKKKR